MRPSIVAVFAGVLFMQPHLTFAQSGRSEIRIFGYFQNSFIHQSDYVEQSERNSFSVQQLNLFFQKDLAKSWRAFINFEFLNNFSSSRQWGSANLDEAWARYRFDERFNLKLGLLIPIFNNLNEIKNRTPLLPYVIRPLVYETSFQEFVDVDEFTPARAFVQAYGFIPFDQLKLDYAVYLGNSPNISAFGEVGEQTGVDTTDTILLGGRLGIRYGELKLGISATRDNTNLLQNAAMFLDVPSTSLEEILRTRLGVDLSYHFDRFSFESELIRVLYDDNLPEIAINKTFYYATLGYTVSEQLFVYGSYWFTREDFFGFFPAFEQELVLVSGKSDIKVPTFGVAYRLNDRITFKAQFAPVDLQVKPNVPVPELQKVADEEFNHYSLAASVFF